MKRLIFVFLFFSACSEPPKNTVRLGDSISKFEDLETGIVCYSVVGVNARGISCVKIK